VTTTTSRTRIVAFAVTVGVALVVAVGAVVLGAGGKTPVAAGAARAVPVSPALLGAPHIVFRDTARGADYGRVAIVPLAHANARPAITGLTCDRVYVAGGRGLCLFANRGVITTYKGVIFDARTFRPQHTFSLPGNPSRARVSADGRLVAYTVFVIGDGYGSQGFSTRTVVRDAASGREVAQLEHFTTYRDGHVMHAADFNFWGVTFAPDDNRFYATLGTAGRTYLVQGDLARRQVRVMTDGVECPSLSPDGTTIVYKQRVEGSDTVEWRLWAMDTTTGERRQLSETRNVDDQVEWLDATHILYSPETVVPSVWTLDVTSSAPPTEYADSVVSPAVVKG
jgi:hypothetical protein